MIYLYFFSILFSLFFFSCSDKDLEFEKPVEEAPFDYSEGYSLEFAVTLDAMGGTRGTDYNPMKEIEDYIDPQKFRVFFFNKNDEFLFESKSRWVRKLINDPNDKINNVWYVSVPFFNFGNDADYDWDWENIRKALMDESFKIALMVNSPVLEYSNEYNNSSDQETGTVKGWQKNGGPEWTKADSKYTDNGENPAPKTIFDFHHSQKETIYLSKGNPTEYQGLEGAYNFIMGNAPRNVLAPEDPQLSSFKSWVDFYAEDTDQSNQVKIRGTISRKNLNPSKTNPIPMYGVQKFTGISEDAWDVGTAFTLDREEDGIKDLPISLLRCVVKLELVIPKDKEPDWICLMYSNIYSRCHTIDNWNPTNEIWYDNGVHNDATCELNQIAAYGPIVTTNHYKDESSFEQYQRSISWIYGSWKEAGLWDFGSLGVNRVADESKAKYPHIFNPCIQRNNAVFIGGKPEYQEFIGKPTNTYTDQYFNSDVEKYTDNYHYEGDNLHVIVYTGERNVNDPASLFKLASTNAGNRTIIYYALFYDYGRTVYTIPIADYSQNNNNLKNITTRFLYCSDKEDLSSDLNHEQSVDRNLGVGVSEYANYVAEPSTPAKHRPYPLLRNHVYRLNVFGAGSSATRGGEPATLGDLGISTEVLYSPTICFPHLMKKNKTPDKPNASQKK